MPLPWPSSTGPSLASRPRSEGWPLGQNEAVTPFLVGLVLAQGQIADDIFVARPSVQLGSGAPGTAAIVWASKPRKSFRVAFGRDQFAEATQLRTVDVPSTPSHEVWSAQVGPSEPGSTVHYAVQSGGSTVFRSSFDLPKTGKLRAVVFGDCGFGTRQQKEVAHQAWLQKPQLTLITGDIVYDHGRVSEYRTRFWPQYFETTPGPSRGAPLASQSVTVAVPGNHDTLYRNLGKYPDALAYFYYWNQPLNGPLTVPGAKNTPVLSGPVEAQKRFLSNAGPSYPRAANFSFEFGDTFWVVLDANPYVNWNDPVMRGWLERELEKGRKKTWRFASWHQPPFHSSKKDQDYRAMRSVVETLAKGGVDVVFCGHVHNYQRTHPVLIDGMEGASSDRLAKGDWKLDRKFDGRTVTKTRGIVFVIEGAGGGPIYDPQFADKPDTWKPWTAVYKAGHGFGVMDIDDRKLTYRHLGTDGRCTDEWVLTK